MHRAEKVYCTLLLQLEMFLEHHLSRSEENKNTSSLYFLLVLMFLTSLTFHAFILHEAVKQSVLSRMLSLRDSF